MSWQACLVGLAFVLILICAIAAVWPKRRPFISDRALNAHRITQTMPNNWLKDFKDRTP